MPCHITRLLAAVALMMVAAVAETPSDPTIGSSLTPISSTLTVSFFGGGGGDELGHDTHLTRLRAPTVPNCGYSLAQATTSSRIRSGVGRLTASLQVLTNCPSVPLMPSARVIRLASRLVSPLRALASAVANSFVVPIRSAVGKPSDVLIALTIEATEAPAGPWPACASASSALTAPFGSGPSGQFTAAHWAANASSAACWPLILCSAAASAPTPSATGESSTSLATLSGCAPAYVSATWAPLPT